MLIYLPIVVFLALLGCSSAESTHESIQEDLVYVRDERTGLCFASIYLGYNTGVLTHVPCESIPVGLLFSKPPPVCPPQ